MIPLMLCPYLRALQPEADPAENQPPPHRLTRWRPRCRRWRLAWLWRSGRWGSPRSSGAVPARARVPLRGLRGSSRAAEPPPQMGRVPGSCALLSEESPRQEGWLALVRAWCCSGCRRTSAWSWRCVTPRRRLAFSFHLSAGRAASPYFRVARQRPSRLGCSGSVRSLLVSGMP